MKSLIAKKEYFGHLRNATHVQHERLHAWTVSKRLLSQSPSLHDFLYFFISGQIFRSRIAAAAAKDAYEVRALLGPFLSPHSEVWAKLVRYGLYPHFIAQFEGAIASLDYSGPGRAVGAAYVLIGSHLGNKMIARHLAGLPYTMDWPLAVLDDPAGEQQAAWKALQNRLPEIAEVEDYLFEASKPLGDHIQDCLADVSAPRLACVS